MPDEDGYDVIRQVRGFPPDRGARLPAGALTAFTTSEDRMTALRAGSPLHVPRGRLATVVASLVRPGLTMHPARQVRALVVAAAIGAACASVPSGPPREAGNFRAPDLVELVTLEPGLKLDIRYATDRNFVGRPVYDEARAFLQRPAAEALVRAHRALAAHGYGILVYDGYRPWSITKRFWEVTPEAQRAFVADPKRGSKHNRGAAADISLYELSTGRPAEMPTDYDDFSERASPDWTGGTAEQRERRDLLRKVMEQEGFTVEPNEWWHFNWRDWRSYPISDIPFSS